MRIWREGTLFPGAICWDCVEPGVEDLADLLNRPHIFKHMNGLYWRITPAFFSFFLFSSKLKYGPVPEVNILNLMRAFAASLSLSLSLFFTWIDVCFCCFSCYFLTTTGCKTRLLPKIFILVYYSALSLSLPLVFMMILVSLMLLLLQLLMFCFNIDRL